MSAMNARHLRWGAFIVAPVLAAGLAWAGTAQTAKGVSAHKSAACPMAATHTQGQHAKGCKMDPAACAKQMQGKHCQKAAGSKGAAGCPMAGGKTSAQHTQMGHMGTMAGMQHGSGCPMHSK